MLQSTNNSNLQPYQAENKEKIYRAWKECKSVINQLQ